jgi:hypothetical protein
MRSFDATASGRRAEAFPATGSSPGLEVGGHG